jgi:hypothetical protein
MLSNKIIRTSAMLAMLLFTWAALPGNAETNDQGQRGR